MSVQTPFLPLLFTDSLPAALSPTWSAADLQQEEMIKERKRNQRFSLLSSNELPRAELSTPPPPPRGSSHMSGILAKPQLTLSWFSVYMPGLFSSVCSGTKIHFSQIFDSFTTISGRLLRKLSAKIGFCTNIEIFFSVFLAYPRHCRLNRFKAFLWKMRDELSSRHERSTSCLQVRPSESFLLLSPCLSKLLQCENLAAQSSVFKLNSDPDRGGKLQLPLKH